MDPKTQHMQQARVAGEVAALAEPSAAPGNVDCGACPRVSTGCPTGKCMKAGAPVEAGPARRHLPTDEEVRLHFAKPVEAASEAPAVWWRVQRGDFEGPQTLDPMFLQGPEKPGNTYNGATYEPLYTAAAIAAARAEGYAAGMDRAAEVCAEIEDQAWALWKGTADPIEQGRSIGAQHCVDAIRTAKGAGVTQPATAPREP